ncbi:hypothetical protein HN51_047757 [Arachis hypogaea]|uniref:Pentacotripeptide-repeat region of PRORP domain-containing protein n=1 Tax=Arachis hypogaea TaxID=3818 RepID=A0A445AI57_ARAHY|nr:pentatricopeptide repeat-containing protein At1g80270, mitochondrial [Arachis ipaensis]XP_025633170.1 pentatricopeptide repeat-containing protein At1g80270, mitochondrial [Arachis hypogaea]QHO24142.1 Pentatricopeptide repeat-containing protein [Arachis hypogaea]QHO24143.1 Pentatricopeptide repeat-containing protein [Arachis hypogaea]RYR26074.1 hypothetical protein Ahy_B02g060225 [Arachis hypogaea]
MWALRRASVRLSLRSQGFSLGASTASCIKLMPAAVEDGAGISGYFQITCSKVLSTMTCYHAGHSSPKFIMSRRELSSQADANSMNNDDDLDEALSYELQTRGINDEVETDLGDDDENVNKSHDEMELSDTEIDPIEKKSLRSKHLSKIFTAIIKAPGLSVRSALDKWIEEGKDISRQEISLALVNLRRRKMYGRALQLFEWLELNKKLEFLEQDYASRLDLIAKLRGMPMAEKFIDSVPKSFRRELLYRTLLANYVSQNKLNKAEATFNRMKDLDLPRTAFACNQMLLLYKRVDKKKIADVLLLMENENVKPSTLTYKILIDTKGSNDIAGMEEIVETMKTEGIEPDLQTQAALARHYISAGLNERAEAILKEMEGENVKKKQWVCPTLLCLYAKLGKADEVERIWKVCESSPRIEDCMSAVEAWGALNKIDKAEEIFEIMSKKWKLSSGNYNVLLKVYLNHNMLLKGKDLVKRMLDSGCKLNLLTYNALVKLHVQAGEVEKANSLLQTAIQQNRNKPLFDTFMAIMEEYAKSGDIHNAEKIFYQMRKAGYISRFTQYQVLIQAYINAKQPAYGISERMKADNIFPNKAMSKQLVQINPFEKIAVLALLD